MRTMRVQGLVRLAGCVRRELARPVTAERHGQLRAQVERAVTLVTELMRRHGLDDRAMPGPSRRAYTFLRSVDFSRASISCDASAGTPQRQQGVLRGLASFVAGFADRVGRAVLDPRSPLDELRDELARSCQRLNEWAGSHPEELGNLTRQSRKSFAWVRYFGAPGNFDAYVAALRQAIPQFERVAPAARWARPFVVSFRPISALYRVRGDASQTRIALSTPLVAAGDAGFAIVARAAFGRGRRTSGDLHALTVSDAFQSVRLSLEAAGGAREQAAGLVHDLDRSFRRVNARYFAGQMSRPRLAWSSSPTSHKFGHYSYASDTVMISSTLDRADVPEFVVDHVMHHELLHKKFGLRWENGRGCAHTPEFRAEERQYEQFAEANAWIEKLAREQR